MSIILEGIDLPKSGETKRIVLYDNGYIVVNEEGWDEDGCRCFTFSYDVKAIQIPTPHGRLIDADELKEKRETMCWECEYYRGHEEYCENDHFAREYGFCYSGKRRSK